MSSFSYLIPVEGEAHPLEPVNKTDFGLKELYESLECGTVEMVRLSDSVIMIIDENGYGGDVNRLATKMYRDTRLQGADKDAYFQEFTDQGFEIIDLTDGQEEVICGNAIVCTNDRFR